MMGLFLIMMGIPGKVFAKAATNDVRIGVAYETFELPHGVPLAGYSRRGGKPALGTHDPVGVSALVAESEGAVIALLSCDLLIVDEVLYQAARDRLAKEEFLGKDFSLLLTATHTHSGPGAYGRKFLEKISMGHYEEEVFEEILRGVIQAVKKAYLSRALARLAVVRTQAPLAVENRVDPDGFVDSELAVAAFYRQKDSTPFAILVNFAAHPTALGAWNFYLSADYPGAMRRHLKRHFPGATGIFFAGAVADQAPVKSGIGFERSEWLGAYLAEQVSKSLQRVAPEAVTAVQSRQENWRLPPPKIRLTSWLALPRWLAALFVDDDATLAVARIGKLALFGVPCDLASEMGSTLKEQARAQGLEPMIAGFTNDYIGYCMPAAFYKTHEYEAQMAFNGPMAGEQIVERLRQMMQELQN
ncbi:MAG: neutral/alkaline non-lysosomal ceramidase N-terminal domain-containing protein [Candidatus Omnitrophica bacterium]|nr:neutral/alkaline non-lysosomal ceramidase N-terminal domain-containing protein [Candidatus Omnitrophota bacterium]